jgi:hypothetical protein
MSEGSAGGGDESDDMLLSPGGLEYQQSTSFEVYLSLVTIALLMLLQSDGKLHVLYMQPCL